MQARIRVLMALTTAAFALLALYVMIGLTHQHGSSVYLGNDEGRLERSSDGQADAVLVACKRDYNQTDVYSRGYNTQTGATYTVVDRTRGDGCRRDDKNVNMEYHWLNQGGLQSRVSYH